ncbi:MAG TPA: hypothetical protein EYH58_07310 [Aquifex aeolicus]|nr:hypothetical protein [Aquifex aeolicus]
MKEMRKVKVVILALALTSVALGGTRYDIENYSYYSKTENAEISVNVKEPVSLKDFLTLLSGLSGRRIVLMDEGNERVWFVGKGSVEKILDTVLYPIGYYWEREGKKIIVRKYVSKVWRIPFPRFGSSLYFKKDGKILSYDYEYKQALVDSIRKLLLPYAGNARIEVDPYTGMISFYGTYKELKAVEEVIDKIKDAFSETIALRMEVIAVEFSNEHQTGINWNAILRNPTKISLGLSTAKELPLTVGVNTYSLEAFLSALERYGKVKVLENKSFVVLSGFPLAFSQTKTFEYVKSVRIGFLAPEQGTGYTIPTVDIQKDKVEEGSHLVFIPQKISDNEILLEVGYASSKLNKLETKTFVAQGQEQTVENPEIVMTDFTLPVTLREGESLTLVSSVIDLTKLRSEGVPLLLKIPLVKYLFGYHSEEKGKVQLIVRITYLGKRLEDLGGEEGYSPS